MQKPKLVFLLFFTILELHTFGGDGTGHKLLFIKGGPGSGGFLEGGADEQLSSIYDTSTSSRNHGWGELRTMLESEGYELTQMVEGQRGTSPVNLAGMNLAEYSVIVFGSNNALYSKAHVDAVEDYIRNGGAALFISDANWGLNWGDAPDSDQPFLDRFGWIMNQDRGHYTLSSSQFTNPDHPVLDGVNSFEGEGVSPITIDDYNSPGVTSSRLAPAQDKVRRNTQYGQGSSTNATQHDCSLVVATCDFGRIAGHFDRNTFFNRNGAGTNIHDNDNGKLAGNLFAWLSEAEGPPQVPFRRGDINSDSSLNIADAVGILSYLFDDGEDPSCRDAADANDDGAVDISDAVMLLIHLFAQSGPLPEPFGACDDDPTEDELKCVEFPGCN